MKLVCPSCGATASAEAWTNDAAIRYALDALVQLPAPVLMNALPYIGLFRKGTNALPWKRAQILIRSLHELVTTGYVHVQGGETRPCTPAIWGAAMEAAIAARPKGLKNHNYLRQIAYTQAAELAAKTENDREAARQRRQRQIAEEPAPLSDTARQAIDKLKKSWGE